MDDGFLKPGDTIHGYVVERLAAVGGTAAVYEARDPVLGRTVALKILRHGVASGQWGWRGLEGEGRRTVRLEHPAFVTVFEIFPYGEGSVLVMEWVDGCTLAERMGRGPMDAREAHRLFLELAEGLAVAHRAGVVHGDLSPANVMIRRDGRVKVLDPAPPPRPGGEAPVAATRAYAAPELLAGGRPSPATDVYAFGAMLTEVLPEQSVQESRGRSVRQLRRLARRCLHEEPSGRPADGEALARALDPHRGKPGSWTGKRAATAAALAAILFFGLGVFTARWVEDRTRISPTMWKGIERLQTGGTLPLLLGDGSAVVYRSQDDHGIEILPLASGSPRTIWHGTQPIEALAVFPGGRSVLFASKDTGKGSWLWEVSLDGGFPRRIAPGTAPAISGDGRRFAAIQTLGNGTRRVVILDRDGSMLRPLHTFQRAIVPVSLLFGPKEQSLIIAFTDGIRRSGLLEVALGDGSTKTIIEVVGVATPGAALHRKLRTVVWPVRTAARGETSLVATALDAPSLGVVYQGPGRASHPDLDRKGGLLVFQLAEIDTELVELAVEPGAGPPVASMKVLPGSRGATQPRIGPDPAFLLFQSSSGMLQLMNRTTGRARGLLTVGMAQYNPGWSPDGKLAVCACLTDGRSDLWIVPAKGGAPERLTDDAGNNYQPVWHPDGRHILFISDRDDLGDLYVLDVPTGQVTRLGTDGGVNPAVSSDGRYVAYVVGGSGSSQRLRLARLHPGVGGMETVWERPITVNRWAGAKVRFSPDGHWLAYDQPRKSGGADIWALPVEGGASARPIRLTALPFRASLTGWFDWGPDWKIVATVARRTDRICILHHADWWIRHAQ